VLEIGTGSGYQTAVLAALVRRVYSVERLAALWQRADARLRALRCRNVRLRYGDGALGWEEYAPFDGILITAAADGVPRQLAAQLAPGGRMVLPLNGTDGQVLVRLIRTKLGFRHEVLEPVTFVPLLGGVA
jgi:protein-L-isoaspartate(D-aspartate) O-methyltransferase